MLRTNTVLFSEYGTAMGWGERGAVEYPWSHQEYRLQDSDAIAQARRGHRTSRQAITNEEQNE